MLKPWYPCGYLIKNQISDPAISLIFACNDLANISALIYVIKNSNPSNIGRLHLFSTQGC